MHKRIRDLRIENGLKQAVVAEVLHVAQPTYSRYETDDRHISLDTVHQLADYYDVSVDYMLGRTDERGTYRRAPGYQPKVTPLSQQVAEKSSYGKSADQ